MARTFLRQVSQIRKSDTYTDNTAPTEAAFETNPVSIEDDLNSIRSQLHNLLKNQAGNWWDDLNIPSALDTGAQRGVNDLNTDLHAVERKRVLVKSATIVDVSVAAGVAATATLTSTGAISNGDNITIGSRTYTFTSPFVDVADNIDASGTVAQTHENLRRAINGDGVAGTNYGTGTAVNTEVTAADTATTNVITAIKEGTFANTLATVVNVGANLSFGGATMSGGSGGDVVILGSGEFPNNPVAAVGAVTTEGTVVASDTGTFGEASLAEVAGSHALAPKNFVEVVDASTRDPVLDASGRTVYGLLQGESGLADGDTIVVGTPDRAQVTFVVINSTGDDLETVDGGDLGGTSVNLCYTERKALEDLTEQDFLRGAITDVPGATTATRQVVYDNQGTTPVNVTTNSTLDLEGAGLTWTIRDDLEAALFTVLEGSAGGTSEVQINAGVDEFNVDAASSDYLNGASFDTGAAGTTIDIGVSTANNITSGGLLRLVSTSADLSLAAGDELNFTDSYRAGSTWSLVDGISLADSSAEWDAFEVEFGEVSLLAAITAASNIAGITKACANVTVTTVADTDVSLGDGNLDAALGDLSGGTFVDDHDVFLNGQLLRSGASAAANNDVYPGTALASGQLKFEFTVVINDVVCVISRA
jgi:hypothetical protein